MKEKKIKGYHFEVTLPKRNWTQINKCEKMGHYKRLKKKTLWKNKILFVDKGSDEGKVKW